ncbi:SDR family oxidoreductase [Lysinibacillus sp. KU-BSD001]|uniref:SDR family NAD(P)-dependent oxidoreductase n=1 Tax=Lysinibacillus sp. KU-BSD001 TaxID=3141328 RepID=UPI0036ED7D19
MENRTVLITGASEGIGFEIAKQFAMNKYSLILVARNEEKLDNVYNQLKAYTTVTTISQDLSEPGAAKKIYNFICSTNRTVNILVNNVGVGLEGPFQELPIEKQQYMIQLNIAALTEMTYYFVQEMIKQQYGRIVNISSISGPIPTPQMAIYSGTKAFVLNFSQALHTELNKQGDIIVTAVCPGPTKTAFAYTNSMTGLNNLVNIMGVPAESIAIAIFKGIHAKKSMIVPNIRYKLLLLSSKLLPQSVMQTIMYKLIKR